MSDTSQGPGWWLASDGKWYAPQPPEAGAPAPAAQTPPMDAKAAKAAAKSAQAHAKALRPWYKKKRFIGLGLIAIIVIIIIAANAGGKKTDNASSSGGSTTATTAGGNKSPSGCVANPPSYPDKQSTDCVALPDNSVAIANTKVTATWSRLQDSFQQNVICGAVTIKNNNSSTISYNEFDWKLQTPSGTVLDTTVAASNALNSGDLVGGGTATGNVCFTDPGTSGSYVGIYKPDAFNATRGIWLFPLT